jgi:hypothetical protein
VRLLAENKIGSLPLLAAPEPLQFLGIVPVSCCREFLL